MARSAGWTQHTYVSRKSHPGNAEMLCKNPGLKKKEEEKKVKGAPVANKLQMDGSNHEDHP